MTVRSALWNRVSSLAGLVCLALTLLLMPTGVRSVRAEDEGAEALMSVDPMLLPSENGVAENPPVAPVIRAGEADEPYRPGSAGIEVREGVIVLNTRGYNYGPKPGDLNPAAIGIELETR